jgi:hypothetical protein
MIYLSSIALIKLSKQNSVLPGLFYDLSHKLIEIFLYRLIVLVSDDRGQHMGIILKAFLLHFGVKLISNRTTHYASGP